MIEAYQVPRVVFFYRFVHRGGTNRPGRKLLRCKSAKNLHRRLDKNLGWSRATGRKILIKRKKRFECDMTSCLHASDCDFRTAALPVFYHAMIN